MFRRIMMVVVVALTTLAVSSAFGQYVTSPYYTVAGPMSWSTYYSSPYTTYYSPPTTTFYSTTGPYTSYYAPYSSSYVPYTSYYVPSTRYYSYYTPYYTPYYSTYYTPPLAAGYAYGTYYWPTVYGYAPVYVAGQPVRNALRSVLY